MAKVRFNINLNEDVKNWYLEQAEEVGMSGSALMAFVLTQYKKNEDTKQLLMELNQSVKLVDTDSMLAEIRELTNKLDS